MTLGMWNLEKIWHENLSDLSTSPVRCSHFTLGNPRKSFLTVLFIHTSDCLRYLTRKQTVIHFSTPTENVTTLTCELQNLFIWLKVCCLRSNAGALKRASCGLSSVALKITGCNQNELLEQVDTFPYLGSLITEDGKCTTEFRTRLNRGQAIEASLQLSLIHIWRCRRSYACRSRWSPYH